MINSIYSLLHRNTILYILPEIWEFVISSSIKIDFVSILNGINFVDRNTPKETNTS